MYRSHHSRSMFSEFRPRRSCYERSHILLQDDDLDKYLVPPTVWTLYENKFKPSDAYDSEENLLLAEVTEAKQGSPLTVDNYKPRLELLNQIEDVHVNYEFQDCFVVGPTLTPRPDLVDRDVGGFKCQIPTYQLSKFLAAILRKTLGCGSASKKTRMKLERSQEPWTKCTGNVLRFLQKRHCRATG
uniref:(northern house mosquito) hypothetical protein n=1 Tax=Culex pipiens TaxID=7175 RepID=A0A8D8BL16_CULPI